MVISLPLVALMLSGLGFFFVTMIAGVSTSHSNTPSPFLFAGPLVLAMVMAVFVLISIPLGIVSMLGSTHVVAKRSGSAGFEFKDWWPIFRNNLGALIVDYLVAMAVSYALVFAVQVLFITIILICLGPLIFPALAADLLLIQDVPFAYAYAQGRDRLTQIEGPSNPPGDGKSPPSDSK